MGMIIFHDKALLLFSPEDKAVTMCIRSYKYNMEESMY